MNINSPIAVTMGDPSGIGPEITVKVLSNTELPIKVYGNLEILKHTAKKLKLELDHKKIFNTINLTRQELREIKHSKPTMLTGKIAYSAIEFAVKDCLAKNAKALVTGPISKLALHLAGHKWPGHTELLSYLSNPKNPSRVRMALLNKNFLIVLNSIHLSLKDAIITLNTKRLLETFHITSLWAKENKIHDPHLWVAALNPHSGESGLLGKEEKDILEPAINIAKHHNINISGPWPADTLFMKIKKINTAFPPKNIIISLYHDQALIPFKLDGLDNGINITAGLPFLRASVDHGTAFDIAGKGIASETPLKNAIILTQNLLSRTKFDEK